MDEDKKKVFMIVLILVLFAVAGAIFWLTSGGRSGGVAAGSTETWMKCNDAGCGHEFQITYADYNKFLQEQKIPPGLMASPPMKCPKCSKDSCYIAEKCGKCGKIFFRGTAPGAKYPDTCPGCGYSEMQERRLKRQAAGGTTSE